MDFVAGPRMRVVLAGGSGQIGRSLAAHLQQAGHRVAVLTRAPYTANWATIYWEGDRCFAQDDSLAVKLREESEAPPEWLRALDGADLLVNLSGHTIACPLTARNRGRILGSRLGTTLCLARAMALVDRPPRIWMNASAATIDCQPPNRPARGARGFLGRVTEQTEAAFFAATAPLTRRIALRTGFFLSAEPGSRFAALSLLVRAGFGGTAGSGRQIVSWIHALDFARAVAFLARTETAQGCFNLTAPMPVTNREFMAVLREGWKRPNGLPWPYPVVWLASRLRADLELGLYSCHALPGQLERAGFQFEFAEWSAACADLIASWRAACR